MELCGLLSWDFLFNIIITIQFKTLASKTFKKWRCLDIAKLLYLNRKIITHRHDKFKCF